MRGDTSPRVISSASEKSFSFAIKRCMRVNGNGKPVFSEQWGEKNTVFHVNGSAELVGKDCNKDPSAALGMTIREEG